MKINKSIHFVKTCGLYFSPQGPERAVFQKKSSSGKGNLTLRVEIVYHRNVMYPFFRFTLKECSLKKEFHRWIENNIYVSVIEMKQVI